MRYRLRKLLILLAVLPPLIAYVGSYYLLSRRGFREADKYGFKGFYFVMPRHPLNNFGSERENQQRYMFYWPLIQIDLMLGTGRHPAPEPMWGLYEPSMDNRP